MYGIYSWLSYCVGSQFFLSKKALELQDGMTLQVLLKVMEVANNIIRVRHTVQKVYRNVSGFSFIPQECIE